MKDLTNQLMIATPENFEAHSLFAMRLCEKFIEVVLKTPKNPLLVMVDFKKEYVESNDSEVKEILWLYVKSRNFKSFYEQYQKLLHLGIDENNILKTIERSGRNRSLLVKEKRGAEFVCWKINPIN